MYRYRCDKCGETEDYEDSTAYPEGWYRVMGERAGGHTKDFCSSECMVRYYKEEEEQGQPQRPTYAVKEI